MLIAIRVKRRDRDNVTAESYAYHFDREELVVGRSEAVDVRLPDAAVSLVHCRILERKGQLLLVDLQSTNGTRVEGQRIEAGQPVALRVGSRVDLGPFELQLTPPEAEAPSTSPSDTASYARRMVVDVLAAMEDSEARVPYLEVLSGLDMGRRWSLPNDAQAVTIGRGADCDLALQDADASRRHVELRLNATDREIVDLDSKNGVFLNDQRVSGPSVLRHGDRLRIGNTELRYLDPADRLLEQLTKEQPREVAQPSKTGELAGPPAPRVLSPASAFELGSPASVQLAAQTPPENVVTPTHSSSTDRLLLIVGGLLIALAIALIVYIVG